MSIYRYPTCWVCGEDIDYSEDTVIVRWVGHRSEFAHPRCHHAASLERYRLAVQRVGEVAAKLEEVRAQLRDAERQRAEAERGR